MALTLNLKTFAKAIKLKRIIDLDITVRVAAEQVGVHYSTLSRCENEGMPDLIPYVNICKWLNVPMDKFITDSKSKKLSP